MGSSSPNESAAQLSTTKRRAYETSHTCVHATGSPAAHAWASPPLPPITLTSTSCTASRAATSRTILIPDCPSMFCSTERLPGPRSDLRQYRGTLTLSAGTYDVQISLSNTLAPCTNAVLVDSQVTLTPGESVSAVAAISSTQVSMLQFTDNLGPVAPGNGRFVLAQCRRCSRAASHADAGWCQETANVHCVGKPGFADTRSAYRRANIWCRSQPSAAQPC